MQYSEYTSEQLTQLLEDLKKEYAAAKAKNLKLDLSRGKPAAEQLDISMDYMDCLTSKDVLTAENGVDCRNYGVLEGIPEARRLMASLLELDPEEVLVGGSSSLNLMHDCMAIAYLAGMPGSEKPWGKCENVKVLCPSPGYDRHFAVSQHFGFELVTVPMTPAGPDMDIVEKLVQEDSSVKAMWCVPKYSNPEGVTYSDETVRRLAAMKPAAADFRIFWDNAYCVHEIYPDNGDTLLNFMAELKKSGHENMVLMFTSTSKALFPGSGISAIGASRENLEFLKKHYSLQIIGYDKLNQLRHARYFGDIEGVRKHMRKHAALLRPKFELVLDTLEKELGGLGVADWGKPRGGYFISLNTLNGCAKRTVALLKEAGVVMTSAGATFPYGKDPKDSNIRVAPTFATVEEVGEAAKLLCLCVRLAATEKLLEK